MKTKIEAIENLKKNGGKWSEININPTFGKAYIYSKEADNELINFGDVIWDEDIEEIIENCKTYGITEFTVSSGFSRIIETLAKFEELGCKIDGLVKVNSRYTDFRTGKPEIIPAIKINL